MVEGEKQVFCVELLEPQDIGKIFTIKMSASANIKETGSTLESEYSTNIQCNVLFFVDLLY